MASHAQQCAYCSVVLADLQLIQSESREMVLEDPPARVWANVRATLEAEGIFREPVTGWLRWFPQEGLMHFAPPLTALACMAVFGAILLIPPATVEHNSSSLSQVDSETVARETIANRMQLEQTVGKMEESYRAREKSLDPVVHESYQKGLQSLDNSIREFKDSVRKEPGNTSAQEYLATAYQQKAEVLSAALEYDGH